MLNVIEHKEIYNESFTKKNTSDDSGWSYAL